MGKENRITVPNPIPEIRVELNEPVGVFCGPVAPGKKGLVISWPPPHGWNGATFNRINMVLTDENFDVLAKTIIKAWQEKQVEVGAA